MQRLKITFSGEFGEVNTEYSATDIMGDDLFWGWFVNSWDALGLNFVKEGIEENDLPK
jgi:hypothetical protein